ncbi:hypothetical protein Glove_208g43 [Diversispora epigaea]|uniref:Ricin B lectin domain-containing protein n=1 Tax=Diversispora epigaea TaxID=1348612 RepID=A0A397ISE1_9GLOM|nr:hypothetical protein Glove_208g43 [Diversispora epigaea]
MPEKKIGHGNSLKMFLISTLPSILHLPKTNSKSNKNNREIITIKNEESGFPKGWFYIKSQLNGHVMEAHTLSVNTGVRIVATFQRFGLDADSQLWTYDNGFIINRDSGKVFDIEKGRIRTFHRTRLCQNDHKPLESAITQRWICQSGGYISPLYNDRYVLHISGHFGMENLDGADIILHRKSHYKDEIGKFGNFIRCNKSKRDNYYDYGDQRKAHSKQKWIFEPERT